MAAPNTISIDKLVRLIGTPKCPVLVDLREQGDFEADPHLIPSSTRSNKLEDRAGYGGKSAIVICQQGSSLSQGAAALLRDQGVPAEVLEGGLGAWRQARLPLVPFANFRPLIVGVWATPPVTFDLSPSRSEPQRMSLSIPADWGLPYGALLAT